MDDLIRNFGDRIPSIVVALVATVAATMWVVVRGPKSRSKLVQAARVWAVGSAIAALAATANGFGRDGTFHWRVGHGGLETWSSDLAGFPHTIPSMLLVANIAIYVPLGIFVAIGWSRHAGLALLAAFLVPATIELLQPYVLRGVGSTDDLILNATGVTIGWLVVLGARFLLTALGRPTNTRTASVREGP